jgi:hypothetical protein
MFKAVHFEWLMLIIIIIIIIIIIPPYGQISGVKL